jgi:copper chaperone CopZ
MSMSIENELSYLVDGMSCDHCKVAITDEVQRVHGVEHVSVDIDAKRVVVRGRGVSDADVVAAVDEAGYDAVRS